MKISLRKKLITLYLALLLFVTIATNIISMIEIQKYYKKQIQEQMSTQLDEVEYLLANSNLTNTEKKYDYKLYVIGDKDRLKQVIVNLVNNAIKFNIPNGHVKIGYEQNADKINIFVTDTGKGIPTEHINRIFERFYRVDKERSRNVGGTGKGLAIVKHIVEAHNSRIFVKSKLNERTTFSFSLNRAEQ